MNNSRYRQHLIPAIWLAAIALFLSFWSQQARAADFTAGIENNNGVVTLWFASNVNTSWVNAHYNVNAGAQQNLPMTLNTTRHRFETTVAASLGQTVNYAFTYDNGGPAFDSPWASALVDLGNKVAAPTFTPPPGNYTTSQNVVVSSATAGASLLCSIDGGAQAACPNPVVVSKTSKITAIASKSGMTSSDSISASYTIGAVTGPFTQGVQDNASSAIIWFAPNPSASWVDLHYVVNNGAQQNVRMALVNGRYEQTVPATAGAALSITYSFTYFGQNGAVDSPSFTWVRGGGSGGKVATPVFSPAPGTFTSAQTLTITSATTGASLCVTLNGATPNKTNCATAPYVVSAASTTVKALAYKTGLLDSDVKSGVYQVNACTDCFANGVVEDGATAKAWMKPGWQLTTGIVHYFVTSSTGVKSPQRDEPMLFNSTLQRWESNLISPLTTGDTISYFFTYSVPAGGNKDSAVFTYKVCGDVPDSPACPSPVAKPVYSPVGGIYTSSQQVTLSLAAGVDPAAKIYYTLDGSAPTTSSAQYLAGRPIAVTSAVTINAITVLPNQLQSRRASETYDVKVSCTTCPVAAPTFSHATGTYNTVIGVNLLTATTGATVHYTLDGSTPTAASPQFYGAIWMRNTNLGATTTLKAIATKDGKDSAVVSRTYTITANNSSTWDGKTTFNIVNGTGGKYSDDQVYFMIIGIDWDTRQFVHVDMRGNLIPMSTADNTVPVPNRPTGYANYNISLAQTKSITIPPIESARIYMSVGKPVLIQVNTNDLGKVAYAGPDLGNSTDPNLGVTFDFGEFNINKPNSDFPGIFVNTSRVDLFGLPLKLNVTGLDGFNATVGESLEESRDELFARYILETPAEFRGLAQAPYSPMRIISPGHASFDDGVNVKTHAQDRTRGANASYLDSYITQIWESYKTRDLVMNLQNGWPTFTGRVGADNILRFSDGQGSYNINGRPSTTEVMLGNGVLDDASGTTDRASHDKQLQLQAQVCAALNRHVAEQSFDKWWNAAFFYPAGSTSNWFVKFWHSHSLNGLAYGFSYDDVGGHSPSIYTPSPIAVTYTIGK